MLIEKYGEFFSERMLLEQLVYISDIPTDDVIIPIDEPFIEKDKLQEFFKDKIRELRSK